MGTVSMGRGVAGGAHCAHLARHFHGGCVPPVLCTRLDMCLWSHCHCWQPALCSGGALVCDVGVDCIEMGQRYGPTRAHSALTLGCTKRQFHHPGRQLGECSDLKQVSGNAKKVIGAWG